MAGESMRDIQRRITSIKNTQQITRAMEIVAATKLRRAQQQVLAARPFSEKLKEVLGRLVEASREADELETNAADSDAEGVPAAEGDRGKARRRRKKKSGLDHPLLQARPVEKVAYVLITADRGLAGGYNANVIRLADTILREEERPFVTIAIGRKGRDYLRRVGHPLSEEYTGLGDAVDFDLTRRISSLLVKGFEAGDFDEVRLIYNMFVSTAVQRPVSVQLLPITGLLEELSKGRPEPGTESSERAESGADAAEQGTRYIYEPSPEAVLDILLPRYVDTQVYRALLEAKAAEFAARMTAMHSATENAGEMIRELNLSFNRARQASITKEIAEIVGGAEALASG